MMAQAHYSGKLEYKYSNDSYMSSKNYTRQGFGGNYKRNNGDSSPVKPPTTLFPPPQQPTASEGNNSEGNNNSSTMDGLKQQQQQHGSYAKYDPPPWSINNRGRFFSAKPYTGPAEAQTPPPSILSQSVSSEQQEESPSVRSVVKNFEGQTRGSQNAGFAAKDPITRTKVTELRESLVRKSNEDLHKASHDLSIPADTTSSVNASLRDTVTTSASSPNMIPVTQYQTPTTRAESALYTPHRSGLDISPPQYTPPPIPTDSSPSPAAHKTPPAPPKDKPKRRSHGKSSRKSEHQTPEPQIPIRTHSPQDAPPLPVKKSVGSSSPSPPVPTSPPPVDEPVITPQKAEAKPVNISLVDKLSDSPKTPPSNTTSSNTSAKKTPTLSSSHVRQKSMEEIACEKQAALVVKQLGEEERQLIEVILPPPEHKTTTDYLTGLFDTAVDTTRPLSIQVKRSAPAGVTEEEQEGKQSSDSPYWKASGNDDPTSPNTSLDKQKEHLIEQIQKKIGVLKSEKRTIEEEIQHNNALGKELHIVVEGVVQQRMEYDKYKSYVRELDVVTTLLLKLSQRLASADNAIKEGATDQEKMALKHKRDGICGKLEDAKQLKDGIDHRGHQVATFLRAYLSPDQFADYEFFVKMKCKLNMQQAEVADKLALGEEQLEALQRSLGGGGCSS